MVAWQVLEEEEYLRRKVFYQAIGQRHYYFMNVGNGEVIDACRKVRACPGTDHRLAMDQSINALREASGLQHMLGFMSQSPRQRKPESCTKW